MHGVLPLSLVRLKLFGVRGWRAKGVVWLETETMLTMICRTSYIRSMQGVCGDEEVMMMMG